MSRVYLRRPVPARPSPMRPAEHAAPAVLMALVITTPLLVALLVLLAVLW